MVGKFTHTPMRFGSWYVTRTGGIENREVGYYISRSQLDKVDWVRHISEKNYLFEPNNFKRAYEYATR